MYQVADVRGLGFSKVYHVTKALNEEEYLMVNPMDENDTLIVKKNLFCARRMPNAVFDTNSKMKTLTPTSFTSTKTFKQIFKRQ